jgi:hypothetical protein
MPLVFISYSSKDRSTARKIANDLQSAGVHVWLDEWEIVVGESISQKIQQGLGEADFLVVLLSKHGVESGWVAKEWQSRIGDEAISKDVVVLPIRLDTAVSMPPLLRDKKYADFL